MNPCVVEKSQWPNCLDSDTSNICKMNSLKPRVLAAVVEPRQVIRPPKDYDHRRALQQRSREIIDSKYPELKDLSDAGANEGESGVVLTQLAFIHAVINSFTCDM